MRPLTPRHTVTALGAGLLLLTAACGTSSSASTGSSATTASASGSAGTATKVAGGQGAPGGDLTAALTAFTTCLRTNGLTNVTDVTLPQPGQGGQGGPPVGGSGVPGSMPAGVPGSMPAGAANGATPPSMPDGAQAGAGRGGGLSAMIVQQLGLDTTDATVQKALSACQSTLPTFGGPGDGQVGGSGGPVATAAVTTTA